MTLRQGASIHTHARTISCTQPSYVPAIPIYRVLPYPVISTWKNSKRHIGIVDKVQETSSDTGIHSNMYIAMPILYFVNSECDLECGDTPTSRCVTW